MTIRLFEAFAGIGSQAEALKELGIDFVSVGISDIDKHAIAGYEAIHGPVKNYGDITKIEHLPECDLLTYSYPCTSISLAGKREGMMEGTGTASSLVWEIGRLLKDMKERGCLPEVLLMENVDAVLNKDNKPVFDKWCSLLIDLGYCNSYTVMNAKDYGTPQNRNRIFMVSTLTLGEFIFPKPCPDNRVLRDVLEDDVPESYFLSEQRIATFKWHKKKGGDVRSTGVFTDRINFNQSGKAYDVEGISPTIRTPSGGGNMPKVELEQTGSLKGYESNSGVYSSEGGSPTVKSREDSIKVGVVKAGEIDRKFNAERTVLSPDGLCTTVTAEHHQSMSAPKIEVGIVDEGELDIKGWHRTAKQVIGTEGVSTCIHTQSNNLLTKIVVENEKTKGKSDIPKSSSREN